MDLMVRHVTKLDCLEVSILITIPEQIDHVSEVIALNQVLEDTPPKAVPRDTGVCSNSLDSS